MAKVLVETSARHVHVSEQDLETLFGKGYQLTKKKDLSQPGQYACAERVDVVGEKKTLSGVSILGPCRKETQVELSLTDARSIGVKAPIRESGDLEGSGCCKLVGPAGEVVLEKGVIAAKRHIHMTPADAAACADSLRDCVKRIGQQILRLYRQFAKVPRVKRIVGENGEVETASFSCGNIESEDIVFDTVNEIEDTLSARRAMVYDLLRLGLFADENGRLPASTKAKLFEVLGFGNWESGNDYQENHVKKARRENLDLEKKSVTPDVYDDHDIHVAEHVKLFVSSKCDKNKNLKERVSEHIAKHKELASLDAGVQELTRKFEGEDKVESEEI